MFKATRDVEGIYRSAVTGSDYDLAEMDGDGNPVMFLLLKC